MATTEAPDIEEQYISAGDSSNLRVEAERRSDADILIAAGWSASRIGAALMRLYSKPDRVALEMVQTQVAMQAEKWRIERPDVVACAVIGWWLKKVCKACQGRRYEKIAGTPSLSTRHCSCCKGSGETPLPYGSAGKQLERLLDECVERAQASIKKRLRPAN